MSRLDMGHALMTMHEHAYLKDNYTLGRLMSAPHYLYQVVNSPYHIQMREYRYGWATDYYLGDIKITVLLRDDGVVVFIGKLTDQTIIEIEGHSRRIPAKIDEREFFNLDRYEALLMERLLAKQA